jgi:hypothetical protein
VNVQGEGERGREERGRGFYAQASGEDYYLARVAAARIGVKGSDGASSAGESECSLNAAWGGSTHTLIF